MKNFTLTCFLIFLLSGLHPAFSQNPITTTFTPSDTTSEVEILPGTGKLEMRKLNDSTTLQIVAKPAKLKQGNTFFTCDSCVINERLKVFEAFGNVHINDADTTNIYSDYLKYLTDKKIAYLDRNVKMTDGKGTLTTPNLEYDVNTKIGTYKNGGKIVNKKTVVTSKEGVYYADLKDIYFKKDVDMKDPGYYLKTDSLLYNTETGIARFIAATYIKDSSGRIIQTKEGYYNLQTGHAEFAGRPLIIDGKLRATGDNIANDDSTGTIQIRGRGVIIDSSQGQTIIANNIFVNKKNDSYLATEKPLMIVKQEDDSIYIAADTLFSARLTDLYGQKDSLVKDTIKGTKVVDTKQKDSTNRYFEAYRNVRIFSDSMQAICDSMFYSFKDSTFRLYQRPVIWAKGSQVTGDTVLLFMKNKKPDRFKVFENSFLVNRLDPEVYNQVKSTRMDGYFKDGELDSVRAKGSAECIYYIQDEDSAYSGVNQSQSDLMDIYFEKRELKKVVFRSAVKGTLWPIKEKDPKEMRLQKFLWLDDKRPKTKYELFE